MPLFVSRRVLEGRRRLPRATGRWVLDSGGYTQLSRPPHRWTITTDEYAEEVERFADEIGGLDWVAPMDWMCEPNVRAGTGLSIAEHQHRTVENFLALRDRLGPLVVPVLQGWEPDDYLVCVALYAAAGVDLASEAVVGLGSICRRHQDAKIRVVLRELAPLELPLHGFGVRGSILADTADGLLASADSMAWSFDARRNHPPLPGCRHKRCSNCPRYALRWRENLLIPVHDQLRIEVSQ